MNNVNLFKHRPSNQFIWHRCSGEIHHVSNRYQVSHQIINRLNKLAKAPGIQQRRTYGKEVKPLRLNIRHFRHVKRRVKARKALKRLRMIAHA